jgi:VWFA-related protein
MSSTEAPFTLKVERNEVPVRVVVRDREGHAVRNLTKDEFQILDDGKPQAITQFSVEGGAPATSGADVKPGTEAKPTPAAKIADRFVALYFDDLVMDFESIVHSRDAASKYLQTALQPSDRVALVTSSGQGNVDFTADRDKLQEGLSRLRMVGIYGHSGVDCPDLSDYEAYLIDEAHDPEALGIAMWKAARCGGIGDAEMVKSMARMRWETSQTQARASLRGLYDLVRRLSVLPGQRSIVFVSKGFFTRTQHSVISEIIDRALRAGVIVSGYDSRGLYAVVPGGTGDATQRGPGVPPELESRLFAMQLAAAQMDTDVLAELADGTGGIFFHNSNDFEGGFRTVGGLAEYSYVLVFSPCDLKPNGKFHRLKVSLTGQGKDSNLKLQARRGYFATITLGGAAEKEEEELADAVFSRADLNSSRLQVGTRFFKSSPTEAQVTVVAHLDAQELTFRAESDRHAADLTFVTVIFDNDGNFVQGFRKSLAMHLLDPTLAKVRAAGLSVPCEFKLAPGTYLVREVVRDSGGTISTLNNTVEIPY